MKKLSFIVILLTLTHIKAQNNEYPLNSDIRLYGDQIELYQSSVLGSWAKGLLFLDADRIKNAGIGISGRENNSNSLYIAHGTNPSFSKLGIYVKKNGFVGIGVLNPTHKLDVNTGGGNFKTYLYGIEHTVNTTGGWSRAFRLRNENDNSTAVFGSLHGNAYISNGFDINIDPTGYKNQKLTVSTSGNVGISNSNPQEKLHINGSIRGNASGGSVKVQTAHGSLELGPKNASFAHIYTDRPKIIFNKDVYTTTNSYSSYDNDLVLKTEGIERLRINKSTGGVGINGIDNETQLHVKAIDRTGIKSVSNHKIDNQYGILSAVNRVNTRALSVKLLEGGDYTDTFVVMGDGRVKSAEIEVKVPIFPDYVFDDYYDLMPLPELKTFIEENKHLPNIPKGDDIVKNGLKVGDMQVKQMEKIEELTLHIIKQNERINKLEKILIDLIEENKD